MYLISNNFFLVLTYRKQYNDTIFKNLSEITSQVEVDYNIMKENEQKMEQLAGSFMKCVRQATVACKQKLKALSEIELFYRKQLVISESLSICIFFFNNRYVLTIMYCCF